MSDELTMRELGDRDEHQADAWQAARDAVADLSESTWYDLGGHTTCAECDAFVTMLLALDLEGEADAFAVGHADSDELGDEHYQSDAS